MKYRRLTYEELEERTSQFIQFLAKQTIDMSQWAELQQTNTNFARQLIDDFSDIVIEQKLNKIDFLEERTKKELKVYKLLKTKIIIINLQVQTEANLDLCRYASIANLLSGFDHSMWDFIQLDVAEHKYNSERAQEIFQLMKTGCFITHETEFNALYDLSKSRRVAA